MTADGRTAPGCGWPAAGCLLLCLILAALQAWHLQQTAELRRQLVLHHDRLEVLERALVDALFVSAGVSRHRRSVAASSAVQTSPAGIPIVDRPYGYRPGLHENRPGMRVYDTFSMTTARPERSQTLLPHHRSSAAFQGSQLGRVNSAPRPEPKPATAQPPAAIHHRASRVKQADSEVKPFHRGRRRRKHGKRHKLKPAEVKRLDAKRTKLREMKARETAEARSAPVGFSTAPSGPAASVAWPSGFQPREYASSASESDRDPARSDREPSRSDGEPSWSGSGGGQTARSGGGGSGGGAPRRGRRVHRLMEELRQMLGTTAAHLEGHTTEYSLNHPHYNGNGILRNARPDARFADWRFAPWVYNLGFSSDFTLHAGEVTVKKPGVYYLYAQINYLDPGDINGFELVVSGRSFAKCLTMESTNHRQKVNTCHTSGVTYLDIGDTVSVRDIERLRVSMLLPDRSFFGLVRLAGTGGGGGGGSDGGGQRRRRRHGPAQARG